MCSDCSKHCKLRWFFGLVHIISGTLAKRTILDIICFSHGSFGDNFFIIIHVPVQ